jgi:phage protein U
MYQTNSFDKLATTPYVSKYVGNTLQEQSQTLERLQGRYDAGLALENQMTRIVNSMPFDKEEEHLRQPMLDHYNAKLKEYAQTGDYHRNLSKIQNDAAMIESMYKSAAAQTESVQKQREAIMKTKASDSVKNYYLQNLFTGESKFDPGVGFRFSKVNSQLPSDFKDYNQYLLDMAEKVKTTSGKFSRYLTADQVRQELTALGLDKDEGLIKVMTSETVRDETQTRKLLMRSLLSNPEYMQVIQQESLAKVSRAPEEQLDALLLQYGMTPDNLSMIDANAKKGLAAEILTESEINNSIQSAVINKTGKLAFATDVSISDLKNYTGGGGDNFKINGIVFPGSAGAYTQETFNFEDHFRSLADVTSRLAKPANAGGPGNADRARLETQQQYLKNIFANMSREFVGTDEFKQLAKELLPQDDWASSSTPTTQLLDRIWETGKAAGVPLLFDNKPKKQTSRIVNGVPEEVVNYDAMLQQLLYAANADHLNTTGKDAKGVLFAESLEKLFAGKGSVGEKIEQYYSGNKKEISLTPKTLMGGVYDDLSEILTRAVRSNVNDFAITSGFDGMGEPNVGQPLSEFLNKFQSLRGNAQAYDINNYSIKELAQNVSSKPVFALVIPGKGSVPDYTQLITSDGKDILPERVGIFADLVNNVDKNTRKDANNEPIFQSTGARDQYITTKGKLVNALYKEQLDLLSLMRSSTVQNQQEIIVPAVNDPKGNIKIAVEKIPDTQNINTPDYLYSGKIFLGNGQTDVIITADSPENLLYKIYNYNKNLKPKADAKP